MWILLALWPACPLVFSSLSPIELPQVMALTEIRTPRAIDFGVVGVGENRRRSISLDLIVQGEPWADQLFVRSDCTCISGTLICAAGAGPLLEAVVSPCESFRGEVRKRIWIDNRDGSCLFSLPIRYYVPREIEPACEPMHFGIADSAAHKPRIATGKLSCFGEYPVRIWDARSTNPAFTVMIDASVVAPGDTVPFTVVADLLGLPPGLHSARIEFVTDSRETPRVELPVLVEIANGIWGDSPQIQFPPVVLRQTASVTFRLHTTGTSKIESLETSNEAVVVTGIVRESAFVRVQLASCPRLPLGSFRGNLNITLNDGAKRTVRLPYFGTVTEPTEMSQRRFLAGESSPLGGIRK